MEHTNFVDKEDFRQRVAAFVLRVDECLAEIATWPKYEASVVQNGVDVIFTGSGVLVQKIGGNIRGLKEASLAEKVAFVEAFPALRSAVAVEQRKLFERMGILSGAGG